MSEHNANRSDNHGVNDNMHTHSHVERQAGAASPAAAKPGKKNKDESSIAKRVMVWCLTTL